MGSGNYNFDTMTVRCMVYFTSLQVAAIDSGSHSLLADWVMPYPALPTSSGVSYAECCAPFRGRMGGGLNMDKGGIAYLLASWHPDSRRPPSTSTLNCGEAASVYQG
jgi:hypothetical protein